ncbi:MAG: M48 family metallopeptidase [Candidatus Sumerlaeia bacterium]|nr:M48 family metallopeptidase [Candidatus Sumerlaeia bacterium]
MPSPAESTAHPGAIRWRGVLSPVPVAYKARVLIVLGTLFFLAFGLFLPIGLLFLSVSLFQGLGSSFDGFLLAVLEIALVLLALSIALPFWGTWWRIGPAAIKGIRLDRAQVPELFRLVEEVARHFRIPPPRNILLIPDPSLSVVTPLQLRTTGHPSYTLQIGLPYILAFTKEELRALLAHELAHKSAPLNRLSHGLRVRDLVWGELLTILEQRNLATGLFALVFRRVIHIPLHRCITELSWATEFECDAHAASWVGRESYSQAYLKAELLLQLTDQEFWPGLLKQHENSPVPPGDVYQQYQHWLDNVPNTLLHRSLEWQLARPSWDFLEHPAPIERLERIQEKPGKKSLTEYPLPSLSPEISAGAELLREVFPGIVQLFSRHWYEEKIHPWKKQFQIRQARLGSIPYWEQLERERPLTESESLEVALGKSLLLPPQEQLPLWQQMLQHYPRSKIVLAQLAEATLHVSPGDREAILQHVLTSVPTIRPRLLWKIHCHAPTPNPQLPELLHSLGEYLAARHECETLEPHDHLQPDDTPAQDPSRMLLEQRLEELRTSTRGIRAFHLFRKIPPSLPQYECRLILVDCQTWRGPTAEEEETLTRVLENCGIRYVVLCRTPWSRWRWLHRKAG